jgi:hypothetical protein
MNPHISLNDMRARVAKKLFGDDWIDDLTDPEYELLREHGPKPEDVHRSNGSTVKLNHIKPAPEALRVRLDRALGRQLRMEAQFITTDTWLQQRGFLDDLKPGDRSLFNKLLREGFPDEKLTDATPRRRGPKPATRNRVITDMRRDLESGQLDEKQLSEMKEESLTATYTASRETCRKARDSVLKERQDAKSNSYKQRLERISDSRQI